MGNHYRVRGGSVVFAAVLIFLLGIQIAGAAETVKRYSLSSGGPGGTWYTMAGGMFKLLNDKLPANTKFDSVASGGSVENSRRITSGEADMTLVYSSHLWETWNGKGVNEGRPNKDARIMFELYSSSHYFVTLKDKNIRSMKDLEGKKVILGAPGSGSSDNSRRSLAALGIKVVASEQAFSDAARSLQDGKVDAFGQGGHPASGIIELAASKDIFVIPFSDAELDKIGQVTPFFGKGAMPANVYRGQDQPVPCFFFSVYLVAHRQLPEDVAYNAMKIFFSLEGKKFLASVHPQFKSMKDNPAGVKQLGVPYHPGAARYWKESGK